MPVPDSRTAQGTTSEYRRIDAALIRMRRIWAAHQPRTPLDAPPGEPPALVGSVELSTVLVADAVHRLAAEARSRGAEPEVGVAAVAQDLGVAPSTASRLVDRAVATQAIERTPSSRDGRRAVLRVTPAGERLIAAATGSRLDYLGRVLDGWSVRDVATLARLLDRFADRVHDSFPNHHTKETH